MVKFILLISTWFVPKDQTMMTHNHLLNALLEQQLQILQNAGHFFFLFNINLKAY